ncbi:MAG: hypothetical protein P1U36_06450 [Legionellaceae bacterium]|nr:hypothetical protein [Legionellaceae bacterium]
MPTTLTRDNDESRPEQTSINYRRYLILALSTGASLILGLLSFGGMFALWPALIPAASGFALSVVYEFEIYSQNLTRAFEKLFSANYFEKQLPRYYLLHYFQTESLDPKRGIFFKKYEQALRENKLERLPELEKREAIKNAKNTYDAACQEAYREDLNQDEQRKAFKNMNDTKAVLDDLKKLDKLDKLEQLFDKQINAGDTYTASNSKPAKQAEEKQLHDFLHNSRDDGPPSIYEEYKKSEARRRIYIPALKIFALLTTLSMSLGTSYLLVEFFSLVPWLAAMPAVLPVIIVPLSVLGGIAYGLLTYNAVTNLMANDTVFSWARKIRNNFNSDSSKLSKITMPATAGLLFALAMTLTICTAGTWWTIAQQVRPLFGWMRRIPTFFMAVINPVIMWFSSLAFNIENTSGTLHELFPEHDSNDPIDNSPSRWEEIKTAFSNTAKHLWEKENVAQWVNPFRPALYFVLSLRYMLFAGHLFSIGVTADRIPKLSQYVSSCLGGLSEGFEDWDYFFGEHEHPKTLHALLQARLGESQGHNHDQDLPTKLVAFCARPFYHAAAHWDAYFSTFNHDKETHITYETSWGKLHDAFIPKDESTACSCCPPNQIQSQICLPISARNTQPTKSPRLFTAPQSRENLGYSNTEAPAPSPAQDDLEESLVRSGCSVM